MAGTKQGESGWYQAGQKVYFLEITEDGEWRKQKGPMDVVEWHEVTRQLEVTCPSPEAEGNPHCIHRRGVHMG